MKRLKEIIKKMPITGDIALKQYIIFQQKKNINTLLLNTMLKSGSHFLMSIMANYLFFQYIKNEGHIGFLEMKKHIWNAEIKESKKLSIICLQTGFSNFVWQHDNEYIKYNNAKKIVHMYRNPLDLIVSRYFWFNKSRKCHTDINSPQEYIETDLKRFIEHYKNIATISNKNHLKRIAYEELIRSPYTVMKDVIAFCGIEYSHENLEKSIQESSRKKVRDDEKKYGVDGSNVVGENMKSSFVRSGAIGEWKQYFDAKDVLKIEEILGKEKIFLDEFILE